MLRERKSLKTWLHDMYSYTFINKTAINNGLHQLTRLLVNVLSQYDLILSFLYYLLFNLNS